MADNQYGNCELCGVELDDTSKGGICVSCLKQKEDESWEHTSVPVSYGGVNSVLIFLGWLAIIGSVLFGLFVFIASESIAASLPVAIGGICFGAFFIGMGQIILLLKKILNALND